MNTSNLQNKLICLLILLTFSANQTFAQSGGAFEITQSVISGGGQQSSGGIFSLGGTIGQPLSNDGMSGGDFDLSSGFWSFSPSDAGLGVESDVAGRPRGDGTIQSNDVVQVQRFQIGLDQPFQSNEFQRADTAPLLSSGDGFLQSNDVVQAQRFQIGLDPQQFAAGPLTSGFAGPLSKTEANEQVLAARKAPRELRVESTSIGQGQTQVVVNIRVDAFGDESAYGFVMTYNQAAFAGASVGIGTAGGSRFCNTSVAGQISCSINNFPDDQPGSSTDQIGEIHPGNDQLLVKITFTLAANPPTGQTPLTFTNVNSSNDAAQALAITPQNGTVNILGPTAAQVSIGGRVMTANGQGIRNVSVTLTDLNGRIRTTTTASFGYYRFEDVPVGETYIISIFSGRFIFSQPTQVVTVLEALADINFIADQL